MTAQTRPDPVSGARAGTPRPAHTTSPVPASRGAARVAGVLFLAAMLTYGPGTGITTGVLTAPDLLPNVAAHQLTFTLGAVLMLLNSVIVIAIGVVLFPVLKPHSERIALGYLASRLVEGVLLTVGVVSLLSLTGLGAAYVEAGAAAAAHLETTAALAIQVNDLSYQVGMAALGVGSPFLCYLLYRTGLVPRGLAAWGFAGYALLLAGSVSELFGVGVGLLLALPGGLFEVVLGLWLIVKGFHPSAAGPTSPR